MRYARSAGNIDRLLLSAPVLVTRSIELSKTALEIPLLGMHKTVSVLSEVVPGWPATSA
jgi:hypothetical protein